MKEWFWLTNEPVRVAFIRNLFVIEIRCQVIWNLKILFLPYLCVYQKMLIECTNNLKHWSKLFYKKLLLLDKNWSFPSGHWKQLLRICSHNGLRNFLYNFPIAVVWSDDYLGKKWYTFMQLWVISPGSLVLKNYSNSFFYNLLGLGNSFWVDLGYFSEIILESINCQFWSKFWNEAGNLHGSEDLL